MVQRVAPHVLCLLVCGLLFSGCWLKPAIPWAQLREERDTLIHQRETRAAELSKELYAIGLQARKAGDRSLALACFSRAASLDPSWMLAHLNAAVLHPLVDNDIAAALDHAHRAAGLAPGNPRAHLVYGTLLLEAGKCPEAFEALQRAVELRQSVVEAHCRLSRAAACAGHPQQAIDELLYLIAQHPRQTAYYLDLALLYEKLDMLPEAVETADRALEASDRNKVTLLQVRSLFSRAGQIQRVQEIDEELQRRFPAEPKRKMRPLQPSKGRKAPQRDLRRRY